MELLCPAGSPEALRAAVQCGADAVYLGWGSFNARQSARNFTDEEFFSAIRYCHERGVKVYLTLNTLLTDRELPQAAACARQASAAGVDAVLVQDWGLLALLRSALPDLPLHASTQMSLFTSGGASEAVRAGCERIVLARECSREDVRAIAARCGAEVEIFGHGALCMCYSGQCAMSALIGGRSGNRGRCAQPCRLPYGVDGPARGGHPLSLKDFCLADALAETERSGAVCLKLEGRMKRPEYVAVVTDIYARLLREKRTPTAQERAALEQAFSRQGFTDYYWKGRKGPGMFGSRPEDLPEPKELFASARAAYESETNRTVPVRFSCSVLTGQPARLTAFDGAHTVCVSGPVPETARTRAVTPEALRERLMKTGGTAYRCEHVEVTADEGLSLSAAAVNSLRRDALAALSDQRCAVPPRRSLPLTPPPDDGGRADSMEFTVSLASAEQLSKELPALAPARISLPLAAFAALPALPEFGGLWCAELPRVWRDGDEPELRRALERVRELGAAGVLLGNLGHLPLVRDMGLSLFGDFGLNVFNSHALEFLRRQGLSSACLSFELRLAQIRDLRKPLPTEAILYGRLPLMITENCLVRNAQGCGKEHCGSCVPADGACAGEHFLSDRTGARFPLLGVYGHRTEVENSLPLYLGDRLDDCRGLGLAFGRLRFTTESAADCVRIFRAYRAGSPPAGPFTRGLCDRGVE